MEYMPMSSYVITLFCPAEQGCLGRVTGPVTDSRCESFYVDGRPGM